MDSGTDESQWTDYRPEPLCAVLRCPVCLDFYEKPHTLGCGHSFCLRCLRTLAKMARTSTTRSPLDRLRFRCPACRKMTVARPLLRRRASVTIALQDVVDAWFNSPYSVGRLEIMSLRSTACQTDDTGEVVVLNINEKTNSENEIVKTIEIENDKDTENVRQGRADNEAKENETDENDKDSEGAEQMSTDDEEEENLTEEKDKDKQGKNDINISCEEIRQVLVHRFLLRSSKEDLVDAERDNKDNLVDANDGSASSDVNLDTSSSEEDSDPDVVPFLGEIQVIEEPEARNILAIRSFVTVIKYMFTELCALFRGIRDSRCRLCLTVFWFLYGGLIIYLSRGFLPWMVLYTIVYFAIMYAEMSRPFMMRY